MRVTFSIPDHVVEHLNQIHEETGIAKSRIVSWLVEDYYDYWNNGYPSGPGYPKGPGSFAAPDVKNGDAE